MASRFLIEVPHEEAAIPCIRAIDVFLKTGSHFLTNADWGCKDGDHRAWMIVEVDSKEEARNIVPPAFRSQARVVGLNAWSPEDLKELIEKHGI
ncbi:MAG TPA: hypothetical protein VIG29_01950 [Vicinamibacteria bacterium]